MMDDSTGQTYVKVLFFASARELAGVKESKILICRHINSTELLEKIVSIFGLESIRSNVILAVNEEFISNNVKLELCDRDEVAIIPPLSGGSYFFFIFRNYIMKLNNMLCLFNLCIYFIIG